MLRKGPIIGDYIRKATKKNRKWYIPSIIASTLKFAEMENPLKKKLKSYLSYKTYQYLNVIPLVNSSLNQ